MHRPNILVFMADQMVADVVRPDHPCMMPHAERLAGEGVRFDQTYCPTAHCSPSRATFFTGQMPSVHGVWNNVANRCAISRELARGVTTLGECLREAGYALGFSGKWHVSDVESPADRGWEEFQPVRKNLWEHSRIAMVDERHAAGQAEPEGVGVYQRPGWGAVQLYRTVDDDAHKGGAKVVEDGIRAVREMAGRDTPWCVYVSCGPPHDPYFAPKRHVDQYAGMDIPLPESFADTLEDKPRIYQRMRRQYWDQLSDDETRESVKHYWALCTMVDEWLGRLLAALDETGQTDNTLVVFTSDHGDYAAAHGLWCKGVPAFREAYHVPAVVRWPAGIANAGRRVDALVSLADFMPTFLELAGAEPPAMYGASLVPFLCGETPADWRDAIFMQLNGVELYYTQRIVQTTRWKYVYNGFDFDELYDLEADPHEVTNLASPDRYDQSVRERNGRYVPWPRMTEELETVRERLYTRLWRFAREHQDHFIYTPYLTTAQATHGPLLGVPHESHSRRAQGPHLE